MDFLAHNNQAWELESKGGSAWSSIVPEEDIRAAREGRYQFSMSPDGTPIPGSWLRPIRDAELLCLAGGGGQQGPLLSAMGAKVTVFDFSLNQLHLEELAMEKYGLAYATCQGDMRDLSRFPEGTFDLVVNPASNLFIEDLSKLWTECFRVLKPGGKLLSSSMNPIVFAFGRDELDVNANPTLKYPVPYSDIANLTKKELDAKIASNQLLEFGHSLDQIIGEQIAAGFALVGFQEGYWGKRFDVKADHMFPQYLITCAEKRTEGM